MFHAQACLEHRHSYVRKNAALAVLNIHHNFGSDLLPDGPELIDKFIRVCSPSSPLLIDIFAARLAFLHMLSIPWGQLVGCGRV
jgi:hypothetical protein